MTKSNLAGIAAAAIAVALAGCATGEKSLQDKGYAPMSQAELEQENLRTRTINWRSPAGSGGTATYEPDGTARVTWKDGTDEGRWRIVDGRFCSQWTTIRNGAENCATTYKIGENEYQTYNPDGTLNATFSYVD